MTPPLRSSPTMPWGVRGCGSGPPAARRQLEAGIARATPDPHRAPGAGWSTSWGGLPRECRADPLVAGVPEQALVRLQEALAGAHALSHPFSRAYVWCWAAVVAQFCRDVLAVRARRGGRHGGDCAWLAPHPDAGNVGQDAGGRRSGDHAGLSPLGGDGEDPAWMGTGHAGAGRGGPGPGLPGIATMQATGAALFVPYMCTLLADVAAHLGHPADGLQALTEAHTLVEHHEERWWEAEVARLRGVVLLRQPEPAQAEAEAWLQRAWRPPDARRRNRAELRAAISLAHLWQQQGKREEARELLAPIYGWFTEGFDTADLQEAKALLEELAG